MGTKRKKAGQSDGFCSLSLRTLIVLLVLLYAIDAGIVAVLMCYVNNWQVLSFTEFWNELSAFQTNVVDCTLVLCIRVVVTPLLVVLACHFCKPISMTDDTSTSSSSSSIKGGANQNGNGNSYLNDETTPLLRSGGAGGGGAGGGASGKGRERVERKRGNIQESDGDDDDAVVTIQQQQQQQQPPPPPPPPPPQPDVIATVKGKTGNSPTSSDMDSSDDDDNNNNNNSNNNNNNNSKARPKERVTYALNKRAGLKRNLFIAAIFLVDTAIQAFIGVKCVSFHYGNLNVNLAGTLLCIQVLFVILEAVVAQWIVQDATKMEGVFVKEFHIHPLYYIEGLPGHACDLCRSRMRRGYRCHSCDHDVCMACFSSKSRLGGEGVLRGDKGVKQETEVSNTKFMRRALSLARPQIGLFVLAFLCLIINTLATLLLPNYQGQILDHVVAQDSSGFKRSVLLYLGLSIATGLFGALRSLAFSIVGRKMACDVRSRLFNAVIVQDIAFFDGMHSGELSSRLSNDISAMVAPCQTMLASLFQNTLSLIGGIAMCFYTSWRLSMLAFTMVAPIVYCTKVYAEWSRNLNRQIYAALGDALQVASEAFQNIRTVRAFSTELLEIKRYNKHIVEALTNGIRDAWGGAGTYALTNYLDLGAGVLILWYGGELALDDSQTLSVGKLITFQLYWNMISNAYNGFADLLSSFTRAGGAAQRVISLMDMLPDIDPNRGIVLSSPLRGEIVLKDVDFTYQMRPNQQILQHINISVRPGSVCAFVGKSGGGKSTLLSLLIRFYDPSSGKILIDGHDLKDLNLKSYHQQIGIVTQDTQLFNANIEANIAYGLDSYTQEELIEAAQLANAHDFISKFPDGYATRVGERGVRLSGGQKQRIAIARAFLRRPRILLLDEATSALDAESEAQVQEALDRLIKMGGHTVLLVAHRLSTVQNADMIAVIDGGRVVEQGTHEELFAQNGTYNKLVRRQLMKQRTLLENPQSGAGAGAAGGEESD